MYIITATSHGVWNHQQLDCLFNRFFCLSLSLSLETIERFPSQRANNAEIVFTSSRLFIRTAPAYWYVGFFLRQTAVPIVRATFFRKSWKDIQPQAVALCKTLVRSQMGEDYDVENLCPPIIELYGEIVSAHTLTLYVLNFSEKMETYIYILCHYSTLIWRR